MRSARAATRAISSSSRRRPTTARRCRLRRGEHDIQRADAATRQRHRLGSLCFGDLVAITDAATRRGPLDAQGRLTVGVIVHGDGIVSGHGPGVTPLLTRPAALLRPARR